MNAQVSLKDQVLSLVGELTFANAANIYQQGQRLLLQQSSTRMTIDLAGLTHSNTLTLAVVVQWIRGLPKTQVRLVHVPEKLAAIMRASSLEGLIDSAVA
jgi:phospholipid transport system transporter-binding protein